MFCQKWYLSRTILNNLKLSFIIMDENMDIGSEEIIKESTPTHNIENLIANQKILDDKLAKANRELSVLHDISNAMRTKLELNHVLYSILTGVTAHTGLGFNRAILFLPNATMTYLEPQMAIGPESGEHAKNIWNYISEAKQHLHDLIHEDEIIENVKQSYFFSSVSHLKISIKDTNDNILSQVFRDGVPLHINEQEIAEHSNDVLLQNFKTNELIIMPLKAIDKVKGVIVADNLYTQKAITEDDLKIFMMVATQAGLAIENSQLYELVKHKSHTDSITNLWNHGYFQNKLTQLVSDPDGRQLPISLAIIDIDNFKHLNDTYGHQNGDIVLKEIAKVLSDSSRVIDFVCRYGGEEFSMILTQTDKNQSYIIAERIRQNIENYNFPTLLIGQKLKVTVSIGIATFPDDTHTKEDLIRKADKAMYKAKFNGKNRTVLNDNNHPD